jgi:hypothetical protein
MYQFGIEFEDTYTFTFNDVMYFDQGCATNNQTMA